MGIHVRHKLKSAQTLTAQSFIVFAALMLGLSLNACQKKNETPLFAYQDSDLPPDPAIEYGVLPNGLRYAVMSNSTPSKTASLLMRFDVGSVAEADDERGLAHFLEHMAFNGSKNIPEGELIPRLEKFGLAFGPDTNAMTSFDETIYQLELPDVSETIINEGLFIMRETASNLLLEPEAIEKERGVILSEKRAGKSPAYDAAIDGLNWFLKGSILPERLPIGTENTIQTVTDAQFKNFYKKYYRPENTFIVLVGDIETDFAANKISEYFLDWQASGEAGQKINLPPLAPRSNEAHYYADPEITTSVSINVMRAPDLRKDNVKTRKDRFIESLGNRILSRRLSTLAQDPKANFMGASASQSTLYDQVEIVSLDVTSQAENWRKALAIGEQELRRAYRFGFTQAEIDEQLANSRKSFEIGVQSAETRHTRALAQSIMGSFAAESVITSPQSTLDRFESFASDITPEMVHDSFKAAWSGYETPMLYLSTSEIVEDPDAHLRQAYTDSQAVAVEPNLATKLEAFAYTDFGTPGKIAERSTVEDVDFEQIRFVNNVRLNIKKTPYEKNSIDISVAYGRGTLFLPGEMIGLTWFLPSALNLGGLEAHSADEIRTLMAGKAVGTRFGFDSTRIIMTGSTTQEDLTQQMNLMMAYLVAPGFRSEAKSRYEKYISSFYPTLDSTPAGIAARDIPRLIRSGDVRFGVPSEAVLLDVNMDEMKSWMHPETDESLIEIGVVGDVDVDTIIAEVARTFGTLPLREKTPAKPDPAKSALKFPPGSQRPVTLAHSGDADTALLQVYWPSPDGSDIVIVRQVNVLKSMFSTRLIEILREELGASYSPDAFYFASREFPNYGYLGASVEVSPESIDKVEARLHALAASFVSGDIDQDLLERALNPIQENVETSLESNNYWGGVIRVSQTEPEIVDRHRSRVTDYKNMNIEDLKTLAAQIFKRDKAVSFHVLPEKTK